MTDEKIEKEPDMNQADKLMEKGKFMDSLRILNVIAQKNEGKDEELCEIYGKMSQAYYGLEKFRTNNSISYMEKCLALREKIGDMAGLALDYMNYAYLLDESGDSAKAIENIEKGIALARKIEDDQLELAILSSKADILSGKKRTMNEAIEIFKEVLERSKKISDWDTYFEAEAGLIKVYREKGDAIKAEEEVKNAMSTARSYTYEIISLNSAFSFLVFIDPMILSAVSMPFFTSSSALMASPFSRYTLMRPASASKYVSQSLIFFDLSRTSLNISMASFIVRFLPDRMSALDDSIASSS